METCRKKRMVCYCCGEVGHKKVDCEHRMKNCKHCGKQGHTLKTCWRTDNNTELEIKLSVSEREQLYLKVNQLVRKAVFSIVTISRYAGVELNFIEDALCGLCAQIKKEWRSKKWKFEDEQLVSGLAKQVEAEECMVKEPQEG